MQFKSIIAVLSLALAATAMPVESESAASLFDRNPSICSPTDTAVLCTDKSSSNNPSASASGLVALLLQLGVLTNLLNTVLKCVPVASGASSANACCSNDGVQNGLVNVGTTCVPVSVG